MPASSQTCISQCQFHFTLIMWLEVTKDLACICFYPSCSKGCSLKQTIGADMQEQVTSPTTSRFGWAHLLEGSVCCRDQERSFCYQRWQLAAAPLPWLGSEFISELFCLHCTVLGRLLIIVRHSALLKLHHGFFFLRSFSELVAEGAIWFYSLIVNRPSRWESRPGVVSLASCHDSVNFDLCGYVTVLFFPFLEMYARKSLGN